MVEKILIVVDGTVLSREAAALAHRLLPQAGQFVVLQIVPQLPHSFAAWNWRDLPDTEEELEKASAYVSEVGHELGARGRNVSTKVHFSVLSAGEIHHEILELAETLGPDLICLALEAPSVTTAVVRKAVVPVLVVKRPSAGDHAGGHSVRGAEYLEPALAW